MALNLQDWCSDEPSRSYLSTPYSIGEWTYASNGHVAIRVPRRDDAPENPNAPTNIVGIFDKGAAGAFHPLDVPATIADKIPTIKCAPCAGTGKMRKCPTCHGTGEHDCDCEHCDEDCDRCLGAGVLAYTPTTDEADKQPCEVCKGIGAVPGRVGEGSVAFTGTGIVVKEKYFRLMLTIAGPSGLHAAIGRQGEPQFFRSGDIVVAIMPLRIPEHDATHRIPAPQAKEEIAI